MAATSPSASFEVASPMTLTNSGDALGDRPSVQDKKPILERHISSVPSEGEGEYDESSLGDKDESVNEQEGNDRSEGLISKLKRKLPGKKKHAGETGTDDQSDLSSAKPHQKSSPAARVTSTGDAEVVGVIPSTTRANSGESFSSDRSRSKEVEKEIEKIPED
jgi:hypothetical protein